MLCIASAHRSGSSLVASWLGACGLALSDGRLLGAGAGNPIGHFEDLDFVDLHHWAIERQHPGSEGWIVTDGQTTFSREERDQVVALASVREERYAAWGWKDPRNCLFLDEYADLLPDLVVLALWRPFEDIVASLLRRSETLPEGHASKLSPAQAEALTGHHLAALSDFIEHHADQCVSVQLADVLDDDAHVFDRLNLMLDDQLHYVEVAKVFRDGLLHR